MSYCIAFSPGLGMLVRLMFIAGFGLELGLMLTLVDAHPEVEDDHHETMDRKSESCCPLYGDLCL